MPNPVMVQDKKLTRQFKKSYPVLSPSYLHPTASLASPRCGPISDAKEWAKPETSRKHAVHVLPVDGKRVPFRKVERTTVRKE